MARKGLNDGLDSVDVHDGKLTETLADVYDEMIASAPAKI